MFVPAKALVDVKPSAEALKKLPKQT